MISSERATSMLEGRRIVATRWDFDEVNPVGILELDDGTLLRIVPNDGCSCGSGRYVLAFLHDRIPDNVITSATVISEVKGHGHNNPEITYRLFVFMDNEQVNIATLLGHDGYGFYGTGFEIKVAGYTHDPDWFDREG